MLQRTLLAMGLILILSTPLCMAQEAETSEPPAKPPQKMTIGSVAPPIDIEHWLSTGNGKFEAFNEFETGKVYVIEFWATWCGPCVMSMPHLVEMQEKYADKGVTIVSVSDEELETVKNFLDRNVRGAEPVAAEEGEEAEVPTYGELTSAYCLTTDPDESVKMDYFRAAGQRGIPCAFIVGKDGRIEWIGHPMGMDEPLLQVVADTWDRDTFAEQFKAMKQLEELTNQAFKSAQDGEFEKYEELITQIKALNLPEDYAPRMNAMLAQLEGVEFLGRCLHDPEQALDTLANQGESMSSQQLGQLGSSLARALAQGKTVNKEILAKVTSLIESRATSSPQASSLFGVLASLNHAQGDLDQAIANQQKAVEAVSSNPRIKRFMERTLKRYQAEKAKQEEVEAAEKEA